MNCPNCEDLQKCHQLVPILGLFILNNKTFSIPSLEYVVFSSDGAKITKVSKVGFTNLAKLPNTNYVAFAGTYQAAMFRKVISQLLHFP